MIIYFKDIKGDLPLITADAGNLKGGISGTSPKIEIKKLRSGSNNFMFEPISNEMLYMPADKPQITLTVSKYNVASTCDTDCSYVAALSSTPTLTSFSITATGLRLTFPNPPVVTLTSNNLKVFYAGNFCTDINAADVTAVTCTLP